MIKSRQLCPGAAGVVCVVGPVGAFPWYPGNRLGLPSEPNNGGGPLGCGGGMGVVSGRVISASLSAGRMSKLTPLSMPRAY
jgi:hypothetical protein